MPDHVGAVRARQRGRRRRRQLVGAGVAAGVLLLAVALVWLVAFSPVLAVRHARFEGITRLDRAAITRAAAVPVGTPLARADLAAIERRVGQVPGIKEVHAQRSWPNTIVVQVTERVPVVQYQSVKGWTRTDAEGDYVLDGPKPDPKLVKVQVAQVDQRSLRDAATVVTSMGPKLRDRVQQVQVKSPDAITVQLTGNQQIVWGSADKSNLKAQVSTSLLQIHNARVFDVSAPENPTSR